MTIDYKIGEIAIETHDRSADDTYSVAIRAHISVPTDYSNSRA